MRGEEQKNAVGIRHRYTNEVIYLGHGTLAEVVEAAVAKGISLQYADLRGAKLRGAKLRGAKLRGADLRGADLWGADLWGADLWEADLWRADLRGADLRGADLWGADLRGADLRGAKLRGAKLWEAKLRGAKLLYADLDGADLRGANLSGISGYANSHEIFIELCRCQKNNVFTGSERSIIDVITIHRICWDEIQERYGFKAMSIFEKLAEVGWTEYRDHYAKLLADKEKR